MSEPSCTFCRIAAGEIPARLVREDEDIVAFRDLNPQAPSHVLIIPRRHIPSVNALDVEDAALMGKLLLAAKEIARSEGVAASGYRMVVIAGPNAGQSVDHIHMHVRGGRGLAWPPG